MTQITAAPSTILEQAWQAFFTVPQKEFSDEARRLLADGQDFTIDFNGSQLVATTWGAGPAILLVHGWGGHRAQLSAFVQPLVAAGFQVTAFDGPAHGDSPGQKTNLFDYRDAILAAAAHSGPLHAILAHSLGTLSNSMALAAGLKAGRIVQFGSLLSGHAALGRFFGLAELPAALMPAFEDRMQATFGADLWENVAADQLAADFTLPALLFHDQHDEVTPLSDSQAIAAAWPGAKLVTTSGLGHRRILRDPAVIQQVVDFVTG